MSVTLVMRELRKRFDEACAEAGITKELRHYIGLTFAPPDPMRLYAAESIEMGAEYFASTGVRERIGLYEVSFYAPLNTGTRDLTEAADAFVSSFRIGSLNTRSVQIVVDAVSVLSFSQDTRAVLLPVSITFRTWRKSS